MLGYAEKLTLTPWSVGKADIEAMRTAGFSDRDILDINQIVGYFAYVNRLASGLGVELESFWGQKD
jgi:alkylhydroperoxidase family enzyme